VAAPLAQARTMSHEGDQSEGRRVAIIAGASRGIGAATARRLAGDGFAVVVNCAHDHQAADGTVDGILARHGAAVTVRADVADELDVQRLFAETVEAFGGVDVVVQAVIGQLPDGALSEVTLDQFDRLVQINTLSTFLLDREAARVMRDGGSIVNMTSSLVAGARPGHGAYTASQAATNVLTEVLAVELSARRVTVNALALDAGGICHPELVAERVAFLVSPAGRKTTGRVLALDDPAWELEGRLNGDGIGH
jgi:3-oxoacyl-[acyl-carrier protein] reductase